jgi:hypothetical protein
MPNISGNIKMTASSRFITRLTRYFNEQMTAKLQKAQSTAEDGLKELVSRAIISNQVYKSLTGDSAFDDLQAEFGLTDKMADAARKIIRDTLIDQAGVKINTPQGITGFVPIEIVYNALDSTKYEPVFRTNKEPFAYTSHPTVTSPKKFKKKFGVLPKGRRIPLMQNLLDPRGGIPIEDIEDYGITYDVGRLKRGISRSGRAIMVTRESRRPTRNFPYKLPKVVFPTVKGSKNFIEDISRSREFRALIAKQIEKMVYRIVKRRQALPLRLKD